MLYVYTIYVYICSEMVKHKHCNLLGPKMKSFFVNVDASSMLELHIPKKFAKSIEESVSKNIKLEGPSGITRHVRTAKSEGTFVLKSGWIDFVTANEIEEHDGLVFTYKGNSSFQVLIFDPKGCEKDAPFLATKMESASDKLSDNSVRVGGVPRREVTKKIMSISSGSDTASASADTTGESSGKRKQRDYVQESSDGEEGNTPVRKADKKSPKKKHRLYVVPQKTNLTRAQREKLDKMAQKAQKGGDLFAKILTKTNTNAQYHCLLNIPNGFASKVLGNKQRMITLLPANLDKSKECIANYYIKEHIRCIGWHKFVHKNRLKEGDFCLFEQRKEEVRGELVLTMLVHFEAKSEESTDSSIGVGYEPDDEVHKEIISLSSGCDTESSSEFSSRSARASKRKRRDFVQESSESDEGNRPVRKTKEKRSPKKKHRPYMVPQQTNLTKTQEEIFDTMAQNAQKGSDLFAKVLTKTNTYAHRNSLLNLPKGFACNVLRMTKQTITLLPANLDKSRRCIANYYINNNTRCISWHKFVRRNRLKEGDLCLFELRKQDVQGQKGLTMLVHFETKSIAGSIGVGSETKYASDISSPTARAVKRKREEESRYSDEETHRTRSKNDAKRTSRPYMIPHRTHLTEAQEEIANRIAQKARKGSELFVKFLSASSTRLRSFHLILPSRFASDILRDKKRKITLVPANSDKRTRECHAKYRKNTNNRRIIGSGWSEFVRRNGLKEGDFCIFELRKERKEGKLVLTMVVHHFDH